MLICACCNRPSGPEPKTPDSLDGVNLQQRTPARTPITPDVRLYHRAVVVAQEPTGELQGMHAVSGAVHYTCGEFHVMCSAAGQRHVYT